MQIIIEIWLLFLMVNVNQSGLCSNPILEDFVSKIPSSPECPGYVSEAGECGQPFKVDGGSSTFDALRACLRKQIMREQGAAGVANEADAQ